MNNNSNKFGKLIRYSIGRLLPDKWYISHDYKRVYGQRPNFKNPKTFNEKLQWLKLFDRRPIYRILADKLAVRDYISTKFGKDYLFPLHGVYNSYKEIDFSVLPEQFVLKPNHTSGDIFICRDKKSIDYKALKKMVDGWMKYDYYYEHREWQYSGLDRKILCEELMADEKTGIPRNYKFFCFHGKPKIMMVTTGMGENRPQNYFDMNLNPIPVCNSERNLEELVKPEGFDKMVLLVEDLVKGFAHVRMDMYIISGKIYIGEFTLHHYSGIKKWEPEEFDAELGKMLDLSVFNQGQ